jgi:hypothetical protein
MEESFSDILAVGGKSNSLGRTDEVIEIVLSNKDQLSDLYGCVFNDDAWIRMRAIDAIEKICRQHPEWVKPYIDKFQHEFARSNQPSIQWHLAQMYALLEMNDNQKKIAIEWLKSLLSDIEVDWIVSVNAMKALVQFTNDGSTSRSSTATHLEIQRNHKSKTVVRKANKLLLELKSQ